MSGINISTKANLISQKSDLKKEIFDSNSISDNVLDISDKKNLLNELSNQDESSIRFLKIDKNKYVDLSNPTEKMRIVSELKAAILSNGNINKNFSSISFEENTGIKISYQTQTEKMLSSLEKITALEALTKNPNVYINEMKSSSGSRKNNGVFSQIESSLKNNLVELNEIIKNTPENDPEKINLLKMKELNENLISLYNKLSKANHTDKKGTSQDITNVAKELQKLNVNLKELADLSNKDSNSNLVKNKSLFEFSKNILELNDILTSFTACSNFSTADNQLDDFIIKTYERVHQIKGNRPEKRDRKDEKPFDPYTGKINYVKGALQSYINDSKDMAFFVSKFSSMQPKSGESSAEFYARMKKEIPGLTKTSNEFQIVSSNIAGAKVEALRAQEAIINAQKSVSSAAQKSQQAVSASNEGTENLKGATKNLTQADIERFQQNEVEGRRLTNEAKKESDEAKKKFETAQRLINSSNSDLAKANKLISEAKGHINKSQAYISQVKNSSYGNDLKGVTKGVQGQLEQLRKSASELQNSINQISEQNKKLSTSIETNSKANNSLSNIIDLRKLVDEGTDKIRKEMSDEVKNTFDKIRKENKEFSDRVQYGRSDFILPPPDAMYVSEKDEKEFLDYIQNPSNSALSDEKRAKFSNLMKDLTNKNPKLATVFTDNMTQIKENFDKAIIEKFPEESKNKDFMTQMRNDMFNNFTFSSAGILYEGVLSARRNNSSIAEKTQPFFNWLSSIKDPARDIFLEKSSENNKNPETKTKAENDLLIQKNEEAKQAYESFKQKHGGNGESEPIPMSILTDDSQTINFNLYALKDSKDGKTYLFNPLTREVRSGDDLNSALVNMTSKMEIANGTVKYKNEQGIIKTNKIEAPNTMWTDIGVGAVGLIGGVLTFTPAAPVGLALIGGSSAYFIGKGSMKLYDLSVSERRGWNSETFSALLDIGTGVLGVVEAVGAAAQIAKAASVGQKIANFSIRTTEALGIATNGANIAKTTKALDTMFESLSKISDLKFLHRAGQVGEYSGYTLMSYESIKILNDKNLTSEQKANSIGVIVGLIALGKGIQILSKSMSKPTPENHNQTLKDLDSMIDGLEKISSKDFQKSNLTIKESLVNDLKALETLKVKYETEIKPKNPKMYEDFEVRYNQAKAKIESINNSFTEPADLTLYSQKLNKDVVYTQEEKLNGNGKWENIKQDSNIPAPSELSNVKGTYKNSNGQTITTETAFNKDIEAFDLKGMSIEEIVARIPKEAQVRELNVDGKVKEGFEYAWVDKNNNEYRVRFHGKDESRPKGDNSAEGWIVRVEKTVKNKDTTDVPQEYIMDNFGNFIEKEEVILSKKQENAKINEITQKEKKIKKLENDLKTAKDPAGIKGLINKEKKALEEMKFNFESRIKLANDTHIPIKGNPNAKSVSDSKIEPANSSTIIQNQIIQKPNEPITNRNLADKYDKSNFTDTDIKQYRGFNNNGEDYIIIQDVSLPIKSEDFRIGKTINDNYGKKWVISEFDNLGNVTLKEPNLKLAQNSSNNISFEEFNKKIPINKGDSSKDSSYVKLNPDDPIDSWRIVNYDEKTGNVIVQKTEQAISRANELSSLPTFPKDGKSYFKNGTFKDQNGNSFITGTRQENRTIPLNDIISGKIPVNITRKDLSTSGKVKTFIDSIFDNELVARVGKDNITIKKVNENISVNYEQSGRTYLSDIYNIDINLPNNKKHTVIVQIPKNNNASNIINDLKEIMSNMPLSQIDSLQRIRINFDGDLRSPFTAASAGSKNLDFFPITLSGQKEHFQQIAYHELGHLIAQKITGGKFDIPKWNQAIDADARFYGSSTVTNYGNTKPSEDLAETISLYLATDGGRKLPNSGEKLNFYQDGGLTLEKIKGFKNRFAQLDDIFNANPEYRSLVDAKIPEIEKKLKILAGISGVALTGELLTIYYLSNKKTDNNKSK